MHSRRAALAEADVTSTPQLHPPGAPRPLPAAETELQAAPERARRRKSRPHNERRSIRQCGRENVAIADHLLDVHRAAAMLSVAPKTLYRWAYARRIPTVKLGAALRFRLSDIQRLINTSVRPAIRESDA